MPNRSDRGAFDLIGVEDIEGADDEAGTRLTQRSTGLRISRQVPTESNGGAALGPGPGRSRARRIGGHELGEGREGDAVDPFLIYRDVKFLIERH